MEKNKTLKRKISLIRKKSERQVKTFCRGMNLLRVFFCLSLLTTSFLHAWSRNNQFEQQISLPSYLTWNANSSTVENNTFHSVVDMQPFAQSNQKLRSSDDDCDGPIGGVLPVGDGVWIICAGVFGYITLGNMKKIENKIKQVFKN